MVYHKSSEIDERQSFAQDILAAALGVNLLTVFVSFVT